MKENKDSIVILLIVLLINLFAVLFFQDSKFETILSASFGGVAVSWIIAIITYLTEKRKTIYDFYIAVERYLEEIQYFSQFLSEVDSYLKQQDILKCDFSKYDLLEEEIKSVEKIYEKIYDDFLIIQEETRKFETYSNKFSQQDLRYYIRIIYNIIKDDIKCMKECIKLYPILKIQNEWKVDSLIYIHKKLIDIFIDKEQEENDMYTLKEYERIYEHLKYFSDNKYILLREAKEIKRDVKYKVICKKNNSKEKIDPHFHEDIWSIFSSKQVSVKKR